VTTSVPLARSGGRPGGDDSLHDVRRADGPDDVALDDQQLGVVHREGRQVVLGGPGTGKTRALVAWALRRVADRPGPVVLVPSRRAADRVRDAVERRSRGTTGDRVARTPHSLAWSVLREHALREGRRPPRLVTASERDETIAELLAGHAEDGTAPPWPDHIDPALRLTRAFRDELREMSARLVEHGLGPDGLLALARRQGRQEWEAAAHVLTEIDQVAGLRDDDAHDPASIVALAADLVADRRTGMADWVREQVGHLAVDDAQDLTPAAWSFVRELADVVDDLLVVGDPDGATQTFRGAQPELLARAGRWLGDRAVPVHVEQWAEPLRQAPLLQRVQAAIGRELHGARPPAWSPASRAAPGVAGAGGPDGQVAGTEGAVSLLLCLDPADEAAVVAAELRRRHHREVDPLPWSQMAVVVRSVRSADQLRRTLEGAGVPVRVPGVRAPLREEPVVDLLLAAVEVAAGPQVLDPDLLERLCVGPLGGGDPVRWRRLVTQARAVARGDDGRAVSGPDALVRVCDAVRDVLAGRAPAPAHGEGFAGLGAGPAAPLVRLVGVLAAGSAAVPDGVEDTLWQVWDHLHLAERWRRTALRGGVEGARADADLDAVLGLFATASAWVDRHPRGDVAAFVAHVRSRALGDDRLGGDGPEDAVTVTTPTGAVGERWRTVVVAGVQDGVWPDPRLRGSLLGLTDLVDVLRGRSVPVGDGTRHAELRRQARRDVVLDELRLFHVAVSRADDELVVTASDGAAHRPSDLCTLVEQAVGPALSRAPGAGGPAAVAGTRRDGGDALAGATLAEVNAALRRALLAPPDERAPLDPVDGEVAPVPPCDAATAARLLARLAAAGVRGADPREWAWLPAAEAAAPRQVGDVWVSPSSVERFLRCPLQWYLTSTGGTVPRETAQGLGTLVHAALEQVPDADVPALREAVDRGWGDLELGDGWVSAHQRARVETMLTKLAAWAAEQRAAGHRVVAAEAGFDYQVDDVTVRGTIDRVEQTPDGGVRVVDLKTGRSAASAADTVDNPQLQLYQLAVALGAVPGVVGPPAGAILLHVGTTHVGARERSQPAPDEQALERIRQRVRDVGAGMRAGSFVARQGTACTHCRVRSSCPTTPEGLRTPPPYVIGDGPGGDGPGRDDRADPSGGVPS
jgi:superfamily I DNA/RNA helicase/RecB family exonuclease